MSIKKKPSPLKSAYFMNQLTLALNTVIDRVNELGKPRPQTNGLCEFGEICRPAFVLEENMTVLKKGPTMPLTLEMFQSEQQLADVNVLTEGTAASAMFQGNYMDLSTNFTLNSDNVSIDINNTGMGVAIDGSDISAFYTPGKVQKVTGDELIIPIDITQSGEDWAADDQLIITHNYINIYGDTVKASCRVQIINPAQERFFIDPITGLDDWLSPPWSPYNVHGDGTTFGFLNVPPFVISGSVATWGMYKLPGYGTDKFVRTKIMSISGIFPKEAYRSTDHYHVELVQIEPLFKVKFPRFSYRYKYEDGEYSVFAPWSEVAFVPQTFDYSPKKGYNLGMENGLRSLNVLNWRPKNCPKDVVQIDILYKESNSPSIYTVESFKNDDPVATGNSFNYWNTPANGSHFGKYTIKTELIHQVVASNQLLRPWDNVPRKALAQEITANRLIFANYLQQYDVKAIDVVTEDRISIKPEFLTSIEQNYPWGDNDPDLGQPAKSLKSQRTYQVGVVYRDKYGRETPILTSKSGSVDIDKSGAKAQNRLNVTLQSEAPYWAESYTFYIKETANEYYNIAMDRWYNAEDGGVWLSFPSSERNKITEDTNLILKKKHDSNKFSEFDTSYKVLSISNNAPTFIKTDSKYWGAVPIMLPPPGWGEVGNWDTGMLHPTGLPLPNRMNIDVIAEYFDSTILKGLTNFNGAQIRIIQSPGIPSAFNSVTNELSNTTRWYDVANISYIGAPVQTYFDENGIEMEVAGQPERLTRISLEQAFGDDALFCESESTLVPNVTSNLSLSRGLSIEARTKEVKDKAKFEGRFFVKILRDANVEANIVQAQAVASDKYQVLQSKDVKYLCMNHPGRQDWNYSTTYYIEPAINWDDHSGTADHPRLVSSFSNNVAGYAASYISSTGTVLGMPTGGFGLPYWPYGPSDFTDGVYGTPGPSGNWWNNVNIDFLDSNNNYPNTSSQKHDWPSFGPTTLSWNPPVLWGIGTGEYSNIASGLLQYDYLSSTSYPKYGVLDLTGGYNKGGGANGHDIIGANPSASWSTITTGVVLGTSHQTSSGYTAGANPFQLPAIWGDQSDFLVDSTTCANSGAWPWGCQPVFNVGTMAKLRQHWYNLWRGKDIDDSWPLGRFHPERWFIDKVGAAQGGSGAGIWDDGSISYMHLSYWGIGKESELNRESNTILAAKHQATELLFADAMATVGTTFRFKQDPDQIIYTITYVKAEDEIWNYENPQGTWGYEDPDVSGTIIGGGGIFSGQEPPFGSNNQGDHLAGGTAFFSDVVMQSSPNSERTKLTGGAPYNRRVRYTLSLDKIIGTEGPNKFHPITNHVDGNGIANIKRGRQKYQNSLDPTITTAVGGTPDGIEFYNLNSYWNAVDNAGDSETDQPKDVNSDFYTDNPNAYIGLHERGLNETTIEVVSLYTGKDRDYEMSNNPAIWETEPKEDVGLDIYYAASPSYPVNLRRHRWSGNLKSPMSNDFGGDEVNKTLVQANNIKHAANWYDYSYRGEEIIKVGANIEVIGGAYDWQIMKVCGVQGDVIFIDRVVQHTDPVLGTTTLDLTPGTKIRIVWQGEGAYYGITKDTEWVELIITEKIANSVYRVGEALTSNGGSHGVTHGLGYYNCYSYGTGVESNRIRDDYNAVTIDKGVKASMPLAEQYKEERKGSGLIFSGIYNSTSGINRTNEFIQAEPITKDLNPINGSIQKLFARDTDLVTFCENKVFKILAKKDALFNADGNTNVTSNQAVLGQSIPFSGDFGISKNPESFASESYRAYFTDKDRGAVLRLSKDGLTPISDAGMKDWFRDNLRFATSLIGSHDDRDDQYNLTLETSDQDGKEMAYTVSYTEKTRGWVSFKSFIQQGGISHKNIYYTFPSNKYNVQSAQDPWGVPYSGSNKAEAHQHSLDIILKRLTIQSTYGWSTIIVSDGGGVILPGMNIEGDGIPTDTRVLSSTCDLGVCSVVLDLPKDENGNQIQPGVFLQVNAELTFSTARNRFYGRDSYAMIKVMFNGNQGSVKRFKTLNYEGTQTKVSFDAFNVYKIGETSTYGGDIIGQDYYDNHPKLGWYVDNIKTDMQEGKLSEFIDKENKWFNYIRGYEDAGQGDFLDTAEFSLQGLGYSNSNIVAVWGCTDGTDVNYDQYANIDDGSCVNYGTTGCTDPTQFNYNVFATIDDGGCIPFSYGCTDPSAFNNDSLANTDDGSCYPVNTGCMDATMFNYQAPIGDPQVDLNTDDPSSCIPFIYGCLDQSYSYTTSINYGCLAGDDNVGNINNGSPCDINITEVNTDDGSCIPFVYGCTAPINVDGITNTNYDPLATMDDGSCAIQILGCMDTNALNFNIDPTTGLPNTTGNTVNEDDGSCQYGGCTDPNALNFSFSTTTVNGDPVTNTWIGGNDNSGPIDVEYINNFYGTVTYGLTLITTGLAVDDGSCITVDIGCMEQFDANGDAHSNYSNLYNTPCDTGCVNDTNGNLQSGNNCCCEPCVFGCADPTQSNYDPNVLGGVSGPCDDGSCIPFTYGCTIPTATNYNAGVNTDDGSCLWLGCTDTTAVNYDPVAMVDSGTCITTCQDYVDFNTIQINETYDTTTNTFDLTITGIPVADATNGTNIVDITGAPYNNAFTESASVTQMTQYNTTSGLYETINIAPDATNDLIVSQGSYDPNNDNYSPTQTLTIQNLPDDGTSSGQYQLLIFLPIYNVGGYYDFCTWTIAFTLSGVTQSLVVTNDANSTL